MRRREDPIIDSAIRKALGSRLSLSSPDCPDDNAIAAYLEQKLSPEEGARLEDHASTCLQCQEILALSMKLDGAQGSDVVGARPARRVLFRFSFTLSSLALLVVAVAAGILIIQIRNSQEQLSGPPNVAQVQAPEEKSQPAAAGKSLTDSVAPSGDERPVKSADLKRAVAPAARDEETRFREKARRDSVVQEMDKVAGPAKESPEGQKQKAAELEEAVTPAQKDDDRKQAPAVAGQVAIRTQEVPAGQRDGLLQVQANEPKPQLVTNAPARRGEPKTQVEASAPTTYAVPETPAKAAQMTPRSALDAFSLQFADQTSAYETGQEKGAGDRKLESASSKLQTVKKVFKKVVNKTFYLVAGYWIDGDCRGRSAAPIEEVSEGETRYLELSREFPEIEELRSSKLPVLLHRGDKNYVIRFRTP